MDSRLEEDVHVDKGLSGSFLDRTADGQVRSVRRDLGSAAVWLGVRDQ